MTVTLTPFNANAQYFADLYSLVNQIVAVLANNSVTANSSANGGATVGNCFIQGIFASSNLSANTIGGGNVQSTSTLSIVTNAAMAVGTNFTSGISIINATTIVCGANVTINSSALAIGNSSANVIINSSSITVGLILGSPTVNNNIIVNNNANVGNTLFVGANVTVNTSVLSIGGNLFGSVNVTTTGTGSQVIDSWTIAAYRSSHYRLSVKDNVANNYLAAQFMMLQDGTNAFITEYSTLTSNTAAMGSFSGSTNATHAILNFTPVSANTTVKGTHLATPV